MQIKHHIQIVVVLYKCNTSESKSLTSLLSIKREVNDLFNLDILVYNNSQQVTIQPHSDYQAYNSPANDMLAGAYNYALLQANNKGIEWLLLLDQDTTLTINYFKELYNALNLCVENKKTATITPILTNKGKQISPLKYNSILGPKWFLTPSKIGVNDSCLYAFNSATLINTKAIASINNFPKEYPLDDLDICYFYRLYQKGYKSYTMAIEIEHELSVLDYANHMTPERYKNILHYDKQMAKEMGKIAQIALWVRVALRSILQLCSSSKRRYAIYTIKSLIK